MARLAIKLYANEDGLGPAMGVYYVVQGLVKAFANLRTVQPDEYDSLDIIVQSNKVYITKYSYAALLGQVYGADLERGGKLSFCKDGVKITVTRIDNPFELAKDPRGGVDKAGTKEKLTEWLNGVGGFIEEEENRLKVFFYPDGGEAASRCIVISFGVPAALRAARNLNEGIERVEVFDHAWGYTLTRIFDRERNEFPEIGAAIDRMEEYEAEAQKVFLFPEIVCPSPYYAYWLGLGTKVYRIPGVLGGLPEEFRVREGGGNPGGIEFRIGAQLRPTELANAHTVETNQRASLGLGGLLVETDVETLRRGRQIIKEQARQWLSAQMNLWDEEFFGRDSRRPFILGVDPTRHVVVVQGGATPVWDTYIARLIEALVRAEENKALDYCVLFAHSPAVDAYGKYCVARDPSLRGAPQGQQINTRAIGNDLLKRRLSESARIRTLPDHHFPLFQEIYWAADMIYSRGGGITANDATATITPLTIVEELGQWQTEQIRELYRLAGLSHTVSYTTFIEGEYGIIQMYLFKDRENMQIMRNMARHPSHQEVWLAKEILRPRGP